MDLLRLERLLIEQIRPRLAAEHAFHARVAARNRIAWAVVAALALPLFACAAIREVTVSWYDPVALWLAVGGWAVIVGVLGWNAATRRIAARHICFDPRAYLAMQRVR